MCLSMNRFCQHDSVTTVQIVTKLYRCVVEITVKAEFKDGCGRSKGAGSMG